MMFAEFSEFSEIRPVSAAFCAWLLCLIDYGKDRVNDDAVARPTWML
jgi:hypothetical protein